MAEFWKISTKLVTLGVLEIKVFWNTGYDVIISICDATNKLLSCDSNYIADVLMWPDLITVEFLSEKLS